MSQERVEHHPHPHPLGEDPMAVGARNYCSDCRDRVCTECGKTDRVAGGGTWMSGHCFSCQWVVSARLDQESRERRIAEHRADIERAVTKALDEVYSRIDRARNAVEEALLSIGNDVLLESHLDHAIDVLTVTSPSEAAS